MGLDFYTPWLSLDKKKKRPNELKRVNKQQKTNLLIVYILDYSQLVTALLRYYLAITSIVLFCYSIEKT